MLYVIQLQLYWFKIYLCISHDTYLDRKEINNIQQALWLSFFPKYFLYIHLSVSEIFLKKYECDILIESLHNKMIRYIRNSNNLFVILENCFSSTGKGRGRRMISAYSITKGFNRCIYILSEIRFPRYKDVIVFLCVNDVIVGLNTLWHNVLFHLSKYSVNFSFEHSISQWDLPIEIKHLYDVLLAESLLFETLVTF